jgi:hypothetical protein
MFFLLSGALERFHVLKHGLAVVLIFVGVKIPVSALLRLVTGGVFLLLPAAAVWSAARPIGVPALQVAFAEVGAKPLYGSAVCYAVCGAVLIRRLGRPWSL